MGNNPQWLCSPRICFDGRSGPRFLACRYHSVHTTKRYVHPPSNPTGPLCTLGDNQLALAVAKPRIAGAVQKKVYSNSYQTAVINSRYDRINTMVLSSMGRHEKSTVTSGIRDVMQIGNRKDIKCNVQKLAAFGRLPVPMVRGILNSARQYWNSNQQQSFFKSLEWGSTFISTHDAGLTNF